jgi:GAF domain-containing protein/HAMP domain-containing protein
MKNKVTKPQAARSLTATLAIAFLAFSVVLLFIASSLQTFSNIATQQEAVASKLQLYAQGASQSVSSFIQDKFSTLTTAVHLTNLTSVSPTEQRQILEGLLGRDMAFRQLVLFNVQDQEQARASRLSKAAAGQLPDRLTGEALTQIKQGKNYIGPVYIDPNSSEPLVLVAIPATDALGNSQGTLAAEVNLKFMWDLVDQLKVGERGVAYVVDRQGNLLAFNDTARVLRGENVANLDVVRKFTSGPSSVPTRILNLSTGIQGTLVVAANAPLGTPDWAVIAELPSDEAYRVVSQNGIASAVILVIMSALAGLLGVYLARRLAVPLVSLTDTATRIAEGEIELQAPTGGPREVGALAHAFNNMTQQLRKFITGLEQRVAERTAELTQRSQELEKLNLELEATTRQTERRAAQLAARGQVTRAASQIRDLDQLLPQVTHLISDAFGYYHVGIFMADEAGRYAVLRAANSEGGQRMLARNHKLAIGTEGIVGYVVGAGQPRVALDVGADAAHFDNPDLPETRSEIALPLQASGQTFGALDVQSTQVAAFAEEDVSILSMLADQVAIAIENARLFAQAQSALQVAEETQRRYLRQEWERLMPALQATGHEYHASGVPPVGNATLPEIEQAIQRSDVVTMTSQAAARSALAVPIKLRDQLIGVIDLHETEAEREWTADDVALVTAVADQAALALENARLLEQTEQRARREQLVTQIATKVRIAADVEGILRTGVQEIRRVLGASHGIVHLTTESLVSKTGEARAASAESQEGNSEVVTP